jgi:hypothetical protein
MGYPDEILLDIVKELGPDRSSSIHTLLYTSVYFKIPSFVDGTLKRIKNKTK